MNETPAAERMVVVIPKKNKRRMVCPTLPSAERKNDSERSNRDERDERRKADESEQRRFSNPPTSYAVPRHVDASPSLSAAPSGTPRPVTVTVRILYFSRDGQPADNGVSQDLQVTLATTAEELLMMARADAGVTTGRLLFKMKPVDLKATLSDVGAMSDPKAFHLMLARKHRPAEIAAAAASEAEKVAEHIAAAAAAAPPKPPKGRRPPSGDSTKSAMSGGDEARPARSACKTSSPEADEERAKGKAASVEPGQVELRVHNLAGCICTVMAMRVWNLDEVMAAVAAASSTPAAEQQLLFNDIPLAEVKPLSAIEDSTIDLTLVRREVKVRAPSSRSSCTGDDSDIS